MQITEQLYRYQGNIAGAKETPESAGVSLQRNQTVASLNPGNVFEGTVGKIDGDQIQLLLSNGQSVNARLGGDVALFPGQAMFFEVAGKEGSTVSIRPYQQGELSGNPTIQAALDAAGLKPTPENVKMVNDLMGQQLPIDKASLNSFARLISDHPDINQTTLIEMKKLDIPLTREMAAQFENYKTDSHQIQSKMDEVLNQVTEAFSGEDVSGEEAVKLNDRLLQILNRGGEGDEAAKTVPEDPAALKEARVWAGEGEAPTEKNAALVQDGALKDGETAGKEEPVLSPETQKTVTEGAAQKTGEPVPTDPAAAQKSLEAARPGEETTVREGTAGPKDMPSDQKEIPVMQKETGEIPKESALPQTERSLSAFLDKEELKNLNEQLKTVNKSLDPGKTAQEFAKELNEALKSMDQPDEKAVKHLLSGKEYLKVLKELTKEQWSVRPEQFSGDKVKALYENLDRQMKQTEAVLKEMGMKDTELAKSVSDLKQNLEFMDEINHNYTYLQVPIQFTNQNANGDLYVYTNKKNLQDKDGELSAFLHFDMDNLGSTDISVLMKDRDVSTKFYLEDDTSYQLILSHADELQRRLERKGYYCKIEAVNEDKKPNFVDDFLNAGKTSGGLVHRYSFDIRA